jgi:hypothetical protein
MDNGATGAIAVGVEGDGVGALPPHADVITAAAAAPASNRRIRILAPLPMAVVL